MPHERTAHLQTGTPPNTPTAPPPGLSADRVAFAELQHELRNALTPAAAYTGRLLQRLPAWAGDQERTALAAIAASIRRALALIDSPAGDRHVHDRAWCDVRAALAEALSQVPPARLADVSIVDTADAPLGGRWDCRRIVQVFANLLDNASKYSARGTPLTIEVGAAGDHVAVVVRDRGIGMEAAELEAAFRGHRAAAARAVASGSGIGLTLSRRLVEAAGGTLTATSTPGAGSAFCVRLPGSAPPAHGAPPADGAPPEAAAPPPAAAPVLCAGPGTSGTPLTGLTGIPRVAPPEELA